MGVLGREVFHTRLTVLGSSTWAYFLQWQIQDFQTGEANL